MGWITLLLGFMLFAPYYALALEERLRSRGEFFPLRVIENIKLSTKPKNILTYMGIILLALGILMLALIDERHASSTGDQLRLLSATLAIWLGLIMGYLQQNLMQTKYPEKPTFNISILTNSSFESWRKSMIKSLKDMSIIVGIAFSIYAIRVIRMLN